MVERGAEEECNLRGDEGKPDGKEGAGFEIEGIQDVSNHESDDKGGDDRCAAEVEEEGGGRDERDGNSGVVDE